MSLEIEETAYQHDKRGEQDSDLQQSPHDHLHPAIVKVICGLSFRGLVVQNHFVTPFTIISRPSERMTIVNTTRSKETRARTRYRAPMREPANMPSMTGKANPGAMSPRCR